MMLLKNIFCIILNFNSSKDTIELYNSLKTLYPYLNIIVVDNNSEIIDKNQFKNSIDASQLIFNVQNLGYAGGNNIGIKRAIKKGAEYVWILNPDISVTKDTLLLLLETIQNNANVAAVGPRICYKNNPSKIYSDGGIVVKEKGFFTTHLNYNKNITEIVQDTQINEVGYVNGSSILVKVSALNKIGFMLEDFFLYFEETEWCLRATDANYKLLINTNAIVYHTSSVKGSLYKFYMTRNRILLAKLRKEYVNETIKEVRSLLLKDLKESIKKRRISKNILFGIKGYIYGIFTSISK